MMIMLTLVIMMIMMMVMMMLTLAIMIIMTMMENIYNIKFFLSSFKSYTKFAENYVIIEKCKIKDSSLGYRELSCKYAVRTLKVN